ncbi:MAG TPA: protein phosphatase 2C domain-containing protein [Candidatus Acidoferrales bacterium]|nr:protein phosphatase 2C domain-containing protein [Candidatus Acidoferrales bacterium]
MEVAVTTDVGQPGRHNEDAWCAEQLHRNVTLLAVADGFGRIHGASAASLALDAIREGVRKELQAAMPPRRLTGADVRDILIAAFGKANDRLLQGSGGGDDHVSAASTCTAVLIVSNQAFIAHIGDSRAYLFRRNELVQLTTDESIVPDLVASPSGVPRQSRYRPVRPLLMRALGIEERSMQPKVTHYTLHPHDAVMFSTDGAYRAISATDIQLSLQAREHAAEWVTDRVVTLARAAGSVDNATVLLVRDATEHGAPSETASISAAKSRPATTALAAITTALLLGLSLLWAADTKLYLGSGELGKVTLYSGVPATIAGVPLHVARTTFAVQTSALPSAVRDQLDSGIVVTSPAAAASLVAAWQAKAAH